jgi:hypothetical protein
MPSIVETLRASVLPPVKGFYELREEIEGFLLPAE